MRSIKSVWLMALSLAGSLLAGGSAGAADTIRVAEVPFISSGGFLIAREKGYFKKLGIEVVTRIFDDGALAIPAMIAGEIDVAVMPASAGLFNSIAKGAPLAVILDRGRDTPGRSFTSISVNNGLAEQGVKTPADFAKLKGKRVGIAATGSINHYSMAIALQKVGLDPVTDVTYVSGVSQPDLMRMVGQNTVDVAAISYNFSLFAENSKWGRMVATGGDVEPDQQVATYAARKDFVSKNRDALVRFAMAYIRGVEAFDAAALAPKQYPDIIKILADNTALKNPALVESIAPNWAYIDPGALPNVASIMKMQTFWATSKFALVQKQVPEDQVFDLSIAREAKARLDREKPFD